VAERKSECLGLRRRRQFPLVVATKNRKNGKTGVINHRGKVVAPVAFDQLLWCRMDGFVCVGNKDLKKAMFSRRGKQVAPLQLAEMR